MPANSRRGASWISRLAVPAALITCIGLLSIGGLLLEQVGKPAPTPPPAAATRIQAGKAQSPAAPAVTNEPALGSPPREETASVVQVIDGDTIEALLDGQAHPVQYAGINAPEPGEVCGDLARAANARLVEGQRVTLALDTSDRDEAGRLLRYVYVGELFVNAALVAQGYAEAVGIPPDTRHYDAFLALEAQAREAGLGCHPTGAFDAPGGAGGPLPTQATGGCDPAYPTVCIPPYPPDLDCDEIGVQQFPVLPPDPHGFDGDGDGIGCQR